MMDIIEYLVACTHCDTEENIIDTTSQGGSSLSGGNTPTSPSVTSWDIVYRKHLENLACHDGNAEERDDIRSELNRPFGSNLSRLALIYCFLHV